MVVQYMHTNIDKKLQLLLLKLEILKYCDAKH